MRLPGLPRKQADKLVRIFFKTMTDSLSIAVSKRGKDASQNRKGQFGMIDRCASRSSNPDGRYYQSQSAWGKAEVPEPCILRSPPENKLHPPMPVKQSEHEPASIEELEHWLVCIHCGGGITRPSSRISVDGGHRHTFANPHGIVFEIGCFAEAEGCLAIGEATDDFSWFRGYKWRIAICSRCSVHLGWRFESSGGDTFHGLILDRLRSITLGGDRST